MIKPENDLPTPTASAPVTGSALYGWEIMRMIPDTRDEKKHIRCSMIIAARNIEQVWEYLAADRADAATEIESIVRFGPIVAVIEARNK